MEEEHASPAAVEGTLMVTSDPPEATVTVNGIGRGRTPASIKYLPLGAYTIRIVLPGYRAAEQHVTLVGEQPSRNYPFCLLEMVRSTRLTGKSAKINQYGSTDRSEHDSTCRIALP